jgi:mono/diheme cytochrome c family protein
MSFDSGHIRKLIIPPLVLISLLVFATRSIYAAQGSEQSSNSGKKLYEQYCAPCHGTDGKGSGPAAASLPTKPTDFTQPKFWTDDVHKKITDTVDNGHNSMPPIKMKQDDLNTIIDYMTHTFK